MTFISLTSILKGQSASVIDEISSQIDSGHQYVYVDVKKATAFYTAAQQAAIDINNDTLLAETYVGFAVLARLEGDYSKSLALHQKSLDIHLWTGNQRHIATDYHNIGSLFHYSKDYEEAKKYLQKGMHIRKRIKDSSQLIISYTQLGIACRKYSELDSAAYYYDRAHELAEQMDNRKMIIHVNGNWAALEHYRKNYQRAIDLNLSDIPHLEEKEETKSLAIRYNNVARAYEKLENYPQAIDYISKSIEIGQKERYQEQLYGYYLLRSKLLRKQKEYKPALSDYRKYKKLRDTVLNVEQVRKFAEQKAAFEFRQQQFADSLYHAAEQEKLLIANQSERNKKNLYLITSILLFLIAGITWFLFRNKRQLSKVALEKQQLESTLLQERLQSTEKEAARIVAENQYRLAQKKDLLHHLQQLRKLTKDQRIAKELNALAHSMDFQLTKEEQNLLFEENRNQFHISFEEKLVEQFPKLTKGERELCKFIRMNKSVKEIMDLKGGTATSVRSMRYRIRKKLELPREQELEQFLLQF